MLDEVELKTARSQTTDSSKVSNAGNQGFAKVESGEHVITLMYR